MADPGAPPPAPALPKDQRFTKEWLDASYLFGVSDTDDNFTTIPLTAYEVAKDYALAFLHTELGVRVPKGSFEWKEDFNTVDWGRWIHLKLPDRPVRSISEISVWYGSRKVFVIPDDWINLRDPLSGQVRIVPVSGPLALVPLTSFAWLNFFTSIYGARLPDLIRVEYEAGYDIEELPGDLTHVAGMLMSMMVLNIQGDLIVGAGIASKSISLDGLSQMINTTSSATNAGYGARIIQYWKDLKQLVPALRAKYRGGSVLIEVA